MSDTTTRHRFHRRQRLPPGVQGARGLAAEGHEDRPVGPLRDLPVPASGAQHPASSPPRVPTSAACCSWSRCTSSSLSGSTSSSARPACSTSATSASTPSAPTRVGDPRASAARSITLLLGRRHPDRDRRCDDLRRHPRRADAALRGDYLAIVTLGFGEIVRLIARQLTADQRHPGHQPTSRGPPASSCSRCRASTGAAVRRSSTSARRDVPQVRDQRLRAVLLARARHHRCSSCSSTSSSRTAASAGPGRPPARTRTPPSSWACRPSGSSCWAFAIGAAHRRSVRRALRHEGGLHQPAELRAAPVDPVHRCRRRRRCRATAGASSSAPSSSATSRSGSGSSRTSACSSSAWP